MEYRSRPLARWTIGAVKPHGLECLLLSIDSFLRYYDVDVVICHNCPANNLPDRVWRFPLVDQSIYAVGHGPHPKGVAWKLYPPRIDSQRHEILIDNDIVFTDHIEEIDRFFEIDATLLLEGDSRTYGKFDRHVPRNLLINSGIYGMPPGFELRPYIEFYAGDEWERNAFGQHKESFTFDEQGLVAFALSNYHNLVIIPRTSVTNCENVLEPGKAHHFIGLNRRDYHYPYRLFKHLHSKMYL